jgi:FtsP/CotA-like multicopper oxidase with cupredoxin domain
MPLTRRQLLTHLTFSAAGLGALAITNNILTNPPDPRADASKVRLNPGDPLLQPPTLPVQRSAGIARAALFTSSTTASIGGSRVQALAYNNAIPGPTLRLRIGETLRLNFTNRLKATSDNTPTNPDHVASPLQTNLHLHGPHIAPSVDAPFSLLEPGESRTFDLPITATSAGTHWYHPHPHGQVAPQLFKGLSGALIVEGELEAELRDWEEHLLVLKDYSFEGDRVAAHHGIQARVGKGGDIYTVNGQFQPVLNAKRAGLWLRLVNASSATPYRLNLENHALHLIATDGHTLEKTVQLEELLLAPGQRADVLVRLEREGAFKLRALEYEAVTVSTKTSTVLMTIRAPSNPRAPRLPDALASVERLNLLLAVVTRTLDFRANGAIFNPNVDFPINGGLFDHNRVDITAKLGSLEVWELINRHAWDLPFHIHSYPFQVLEQRSENGWWQPEPFRGWRDTFNLKHGQHARILVPFRVYAGKTVYHCHISEHEDAGMMGILEVQS